VNALEHVYLHRRMSWMINPWFFQLWLWWANSIWSSPARSHVSHCPEDDTIQARKMF